MAEPNGNYIEHCHWLLALPPSVTSTYSLSSRSGRVILSGWANCDRVTETCLRHGPWIILETVKWMLKMWIMPLLALDYLTVTVSLSVR